jgi:putative FmdB family regulatory protein
MPTYEYACNACNAEFEREQRISDPPHADCPDCGSEDTRRLISHTSFVLKGSGWYATDYGRKGGNGSNGGHGKPAKPDAPAGSDGPAKDSPAAPAAESSKPATEASKPAAPSSSTTSST